MVSTALIVTTLVGAVMVLPTGFCASAVGSACRAQGRAGTCRIQHNCAWARGRPIPQEQVCGYVDAGTVVCCPNPSSGLAPHPPPSHSGPPGAELLPEKCGGILQSFTAFGEEAQLGDHPWLAFLLICSSDTNCSQCGGSLISKRYVLTAAHCVPANADPRRAKVYLGEHHLGTDPDCQTHEKHTVCADPVKAVRVEEIIVHPQYYVDQNRNVFNDIALLRLNQVVAFTDYIKPICLPTTSDLAENTYNGRRLTIGGWGKTESTTRNQVKNIVDVPVVPLSTCRKKFPVVNTSHLCAGGARDAKHSCERDSGGPLVAVETVGSVVRTYAVGIVSYGHVPCGRAQNLGVYTKVGHFMPWILSKLKE